LLGKIVKSAVLHRYSVFLRGNEGAFSGILTQFDAKMYVFEQCQSVPTKEGETVIPFKGRILIEREHVNYLVEAP
jgi:hypothetical protein